VINPPQRPLPENTRQSQQTNIHAPGGIFFKETLLIQLIHGRLYLLLLLFFTSQLPSSLHQFVVPAGAVYGFGASVFLPPGKKRGGA
jgi:hypothetical protein